MNINDIITQKVKAKYGAKSFWTFDGYDDIEGELFLRVYNTPTGTLSYYSWDSFVNDMEV